MSEMTPDEVEEALHAIAEWYPGATGECNAIWNAVAALKQRAEDAERERDKALGDAENSRDLRLRERARHASENERLRGALKKTIGVMGKAQKDIFELGPEFNVAVRQNLFVGQVDVHAALEGGGDGWVRVECDRLRDALAHIGGEPWPRNEPLFETAENIVLLACCAGAESVEAFGDIKPSDMRGWPLAVKRHVMRLQTEATGECPYKSPPPRDAKEGS